MKIDHDLHIHTCLSACCADKTNQVPAKILKLAEKMGLTFLGFSDHIWANPVLAPSSWCREQNETQITRLRRQLEGVRSPVRVLVGAEADMIAPGKFGITPELAAQLDYVLLSCSHFHMTGFVEQPTAIAHPFLPCGFMERYDEIMAVISDAELTDAFVVAQEHNVGIEITTGFLPQVSNRPFSLETPTRLLYLAKQAGCKFTFGCDAHDPARQKTLPLLECFVRALDLGQRDMVVI
jgi:histidinol phosphatase-like PHP family hydrolase